MSRLTRLRTTALAAALVSAASLAGVTAGTASAAGIRPATVSGIDTGTGATAQAAQRAATQALHGDFFGCGPVSLVSDTQQPDGTWDAEVSAVCQGSQ